MTDKEIIKALECCANATHKDCKNCPLFVVDGCVKTMSTNALDLINRLQAENERLKKENEILSINADTAFQDGLNEAQGLYAEQVKAEIKSEAIKEFADRLKKPNRWREEDIYYIDTLLKEMVGEAE